MTVTAITGLTPKQAASPTSPLMFKVYERPLFYYGKESVTTYSADYKALVRMTKSDTLPVTLNVVRNTYKVVQNGELFPAIDEGLRESLTDDDWKQCKITDRIAYGGATCIREYLFRTIAFESPDALGQVAFRVLVSNAFGGSSIKLFTGAVDLVCLNGMVVHDRDVMYGRHTSGLKIEPFARRVQQGVDVFWKQRGTWDKWRHMSLKTASHEVHRWLEEKFGDRLGNVMYRQYRIEAEVRGANVWALYSALTYYASHRDGLFPTRDTGSGHEAATMLKRETKVRTLVNDESFLQLAA